MLGFQSELNTMKTDFFVEVLISQKFDLTLSFLFVFFFVFVMGAQVMPFVSVKATFLPV